MRILIKAAIFVALIVAALLIASAAPAAEMPELLVYEAHYDGAVDGGAVKWTGRLKFRLNETGDITIPLPHSGSALTSIRMDRRAVPVSVSGGMWKIYNVRRGNHTVIWTTVTSWMETDAQRATRISIPQSPITTVSIDFPEAGVVAAIEPSLGQKTTTSRGKTRIEATLPFADAISVNWKVPPPELERSGAGRREELRARAESETRIAYRNGVLEGEDAVQWFALSGSAPAISLELPAGWEVTSVRSDSVARWSAREREGRIICELALKPDAGREVKITLRREFILPELPASIALGGPVMQGVESHRGSLAFERTDDVAVQVSQVSGLIRADASSLTIPGSRPPLLAYRFAKTGGVVTASLSEPRALEPELTASITSLLIIEKEMLRVWAACDFIVTRSSIDSFRLTLPPNVRVAGVRSLYLQEYKTMSTPDGVIVDVQLDRGVKGKHRVDVDYEEVLRGDGGIEFPFMSPVGVKAVEGEIGVESRENLEIESETAENVQRIDITRISPDIPRRATRPLLAAYRYSRVEQLSTPINLSLSIKRHEPVDVKEAVADQAVFETVALAGGGHITQATFGIRNKGRQFMRLKLPEDAKVWSVFIAGIPVNPSRDDDGNVLVPLAKSVEEEGKLAPFPVKIVYQAKGRPLRGFGFRRFELPPVDLTISQLGWKLVMPDGKTFVKTGGSIRELEKPKRGRDRDYLSNIPPPLPLLMVMPNFLKFQAKARQSEAKTNLASIATAQISFMAETGRYGKTFDEIGWMPQGYTKYAYFMGKDAILAGQVTDVKVPPFPLDVPSKNFIALAVGNIDSDPFPDIWIIDENKDPKYLANDVNDEYMPEYEELKKRGLFDNLDKVIEVASVETAQSSGVLPIDIEIPEGGEPTMYLKFFPTEDNVPTWVRYMIIPKGMVRFAQGLGIAMALALGGVFFKTWKRKRPERPVVTTPVETKEKSGCLRSFLNLCAVLFIVQAIIYLLILFAG